MDLSACEELDDVSFLSSLVRMRTLELSECSAQLVDVSPLSSLTSLTTLHLRYAYARKGQLVDISPLSALVALETLHLIRCTVG